MDALVSELVVKRLSQPDTYGLLLPPISHDAETLRQRRAEIVGLVEEGLIPMSEARERLARIGDRLAELEEAKAPGR